MRKRRAHLTYQLYVGYELEVIINPLRANRSSPFPSSRSALDSQLFIRRPLQISTAGYKLGSVHFQFQMHIFFRIVLLSFSNSLKRTVVRWLIFCEKNVAEISKSFLVLLRLANCTSRCLKVSLYLSLRWMAYFRFVIL